MALDLRPEKAIAWIDAAAPTHPALVDSAHLTDELFGFNNVPMAVWIDESGTLVRPAASASIEARRPTKVPEGLPDHVKALIAEAGKIPDIAAQYRAAVVDWIRRGSDSRFALTPDQVIENSLPRNRAHAEAAAEFELGQHLYQSVGKDAAVPHWRKAHNLDPSNWTYKRQAWTLETTAGGAPSDMMQPPTDAYPGDWLSDVLAAGGGEEYITIPHDL